MSETPWHSQTHLLSPPISRGDYSTFMVKRFFSFARVNVMPLWPWFILVAIALICPFSYLLLGWGCRSDKPILLHSAPTPPGSPVSSERPVDSGRGGVEGSWTLPVAWLATDVGVVCGGGRYNTIRIGLLRWQLALKKEEEEGGQGHSEISDLATVSSWGVISRPTSSHVLDDHLGIWQTPKQR